MSVVSLLLSIPPRYTLRARGRKDHIEHTNRFFPLAGGECVRAPRNEPASLHKGREAVRTVSTPPNGRKTALKCRHIPLHFLLVDRYLGSTVSSWPIHSVL